MRQPELKILFESEIAHLEHDILYAIENGNINNHPLYSKWCFVDYTNDKGIDRKGLVLMEDFYSTSGYIIFSKEFKKIIVDYVPFESWRSANYFQIIYLYLRFAELIDSLFHKYINDISISYNLFCIY